MDSALASLKKLTLAARGSSGPDDVLQVKPAAAAAPAKGQQQQQQQQVAAPQQKVAASQQNHQAQTYTLEHIRKSADDQRSQGVRKAVLDWLSPINYGP
jgi:rhamnose utilization protein RhaD (predicted bifunctional aldolase and dehydrogenase)